MRRIKLPCEPWRPHRPSSPAQLITSPGVDAPLKIMASSLINPGVFIKASVINNHFGMRFLNLGLLCACPSRRRWWRPAASHPVPPWPCTPQIPQQPWGPLPAPSQAHGGPFISCFCSFWEGGIREKEKTDPETLHAADVVLAGESLGLFTSAFCCFYEAATRSGCSELV